MNYEAYDGHRVGDRLEDVASKLGSALDHLEIEARSNPSTPVLAAIYDVMSAVRKLEAGEAFTLRVLPALTPPDVAGSRLTDALASDCPPGP